MSLKGVVWTLASPYDAYVSHVSRLNAAIEEIRFLVQKAAGYEAGLHASLRLVPGTQDASARAARFREQLASAAHHMTDEEFEAFVSDLGGTMPREVEADRAQALERLTTVTEALARHFTTAGQELAVLEQRGYNPARAGVRRSLRENHLPQHTLADYRHILRELGAQVGQKVA
jgi:MinD-like ATPase involved in chromosome partitioning or flagellar assembly